MNLTFRSYNPVIAQSKPFQGKNNNQDHAAFGSSTIQSSEKTTEKLTFSFESKYYEAAKQNLKALVNAEIKNKKGAFKIDCFEFLPTIIERLTDEMNQSKHPEIDKATITLARVLFHYQDAYYDDSKANAYSLHQLGTELKNIMRLEDPASSAISPQKSKNIGSTLYFLRSQKPLFSITVHGVKTFNFPLLDVLMLSNQAGCLTKLNNGSSYVILNAPNIDKFNKAFGCQLEPLAKKEFLLVEESFPTLRERARQVISAEA